VLATLLADGLASEHQGGLIGLPGDEPSLSALASD
jgi:hypothetical protein